MTWELHLRHYDRSGDLLNGYIAPLVARYTNSLDGDEPLVFSLEAGAYGELEAIAEYDLIEVMVRNLALGVQSPGGGFVRDFVGIVRGSQPDRQTDDNGVTLLTWYAPEQKHLLAWRRVLWPAGTANRSTFTATPAETAVKTLAEYNATELATTANGRWRNGDLAPGMVTELDIEKDSERGTAVSLSFTGGGLLPSLAKICEVGGDYYTIAWQGGSLGGANEWALTWGRGSDKSAGSGRVLFSLANNTMRNPRRRFVAARATTAIAAGQGEGSDRAISAVNGADYAADNDIELFVDARNSATDGARQGQATLRLIESEEESLLDFDVLMTGDVFYSPVAVQGRQTYQVGDRILASYGGDEIRRIRAATVAWDVAADGEPFRVAMETELWI